MPTCISIGRNETTNKDSVDTTTFTEVYQVKFSDVTATTYDACRASIYDTDGTTIIKQIPHRQSTPPYAGLILTSRDAVKHVSDNQIFYVTCTWETLTFKNEPRPTQPDSSHPQIPWNKTFSKDGVIYTEPLIKDYSSIDGTTGLPTGNECRLLTGEPIDPPIETEYWDAEYSVGFRVPTVNFIADKYDKIQGHTNNDQIIFNVKGTTFTFAAGTLKGGKVSYSLGMDEGNYHWAVNIPLLYRKDGWKKKALSKSYNVKKSGGGLQAATTDHQVTKDGSKDVKEPVIHKSDGTDWIEPGTDSTNSWIQFVALPDCAFTPALTSVLTI